MRASVKQFQEGTEQAFRGLEMVWVAVLGW